MNKSDSPSPTVIILMGWFGLLVALGAAVFVGVDLYRGLAHGTFFLARSQPVTIDHGVRYWLTAVGEGIAVCAMVFGAGLMARVIKEGRKLTPCEKE
jgi:hypothetical protein